MYEIIQLFFVRRAGLPLIDTPSSYPSGKSQQDGGRCVSRFLCYRNVAGASTPLLCLDVTTLCSTRAPSSDLSFALTFYVPRNRAGRVLRILLAQGECVPVFSGYWERGVTPFRFNPRAATYLFSMQVPARARVRQSQTQCPQSHRRAIQ